MEVLQWGYCVPFMSAPPLSLEPIPLPSYGPNSIRGKALKKEVQSLLQKGAVELSPLPSPCFYSWLFVVMKAWRSWRPVIDLSTFNLRVLKSPFKMETLQSVLLSVRGGDWMVSLDLKDAYLQVPIHPDSSKYLRFVALNQVYQFKALCFGLSTAPQVFTRVMPPVSTFLHRLDIRIQHLFRRLAYSNSFSSFGSSGFGHSLTTMPRTGYCSQPGEIQPYSVPTSCVSRSDNRFFSFQGLTLPSKSRKAFLNRRRVSVLRRSASLFLASSIRSPVISDSACARRSFTNAISAAETSSSLGPRGRLDTHSVGLSLPSGPVMVVGS